MTGESGDDDDFDGISNILEFMLNLNPRTFSFLPLMVASDDGQIWTLPNNPQAVADGIVYKVETSESLTSWEPAGADNGRSVVVQDDAALRVVLLQSGGNQRFNVDSPPVLRATASSFLPPHSDPPPAVIADPVDERTVYPPEN